MKRETALVAVGDNFISSHLCDTSGYIICKPLPEDNSKRRRPDLLKIWTTIEYESYMPLQDGLKRTLKCFEEYR